MSSQLDVPAYKNRCCLISGQPNVQEHKAKHSPAKKLHGNFFSNPLVGYTLHLSKHCLLYFHCPRRSTSWSCLSFSYSSSVHTNISLLQIRVKRNCRQKLSILYLYKPRQDKTDATHRYHEVCSENVENVMKKWELSFHELYRNSQARCQNERLILHFSALKAGSCFRTLFEGVWICHSVGRGGWRWVEQVTDRSNVIAFSPFTHSPYVLLVNWHGLET